MEELRTYLIRIVIAAMVTGAASALCSSSGVKRVVRLCGGVCLALLVLGPLLHLDLDAVTRQFEALQTSGQQFSQSGVQTAQQQLQQIISEQTATYILDKAEACQAQITVEVQTSTYADYYCIPSQVQITGKVTPEQKLELMQVLTEDLGLTKEQIQWNTSG